MKYLSLILIVTSIAVSSCCKEPASQPKKNKSSEYMLLSTAWYQISAEKKALYHQAYNIAKMRIDQIAKQEHEKQPAVVLDIDETVLDNSPYQGWCIENDSTFSKKSWDRWVRKAKAEALTGAKSFTKYAKEKGVEVIYISNRHVSQLQPTIENMQAKGFPNAAGEFIFLKDSTSNKSYRRDKVSQKYEIALLVGDNLGDFDHLYDTRKNGNAHKVLQEQKDLFGKKFIVLPNPMYGKWERPVQKMKGDYLENLKKQLKSF